MRSLALVVVLQAAAPPLPAITIDSFPTSARETISRVYRDAAAQPDNVERVGALARTLHAWEQWHAADQVYQRLQQLAPRAFEWHYLDAVVLQRLANHAEAAARLHSALAITPGHLPARLRLAEALLEAGRSDEAEPLFAVLAKEPAAEPAAAVGLGRIAAARGRHDQAVASFERAVSLFPELGAAHYGLARSYRALGRAEDARRALALYERYTARWPALEDPVLAAVTALKDDPRAQMRKGTRLADAGDVNGAIVEHEAALKADPSLAEAHANLISLYGRAGNFAKAEEHYKTAVSSGVNLADVHYDYGVVLGMQARWPDAADAYRRTLAANPYHAQARNNLGQILERERQLDAALAEYRRAIEAQPGFRLARFNLGRMLIALGRPDEAVAELQLLAEPRDAEAAKYLFALSVAHVRAGHRDEGLKWGEEARQLAAASGQPELAAAIERDLARLR